MTLPRILLAMCAALALLGACGGGGGSANPPQPVAFDTLVLQAPPAIPEGTYVWKTQAEFTAAWTGAPQTYPGDPSPVTDKPVPQVDFQSRAVVGVSLGVGIRCYVPQITEVSSSNGDLLVKYKSAGPNGPTTLACLHNWPLVVLATVPKVGGGVSFLRVDN